MRGAQTTLRIVRLADRSARRSAPVPVPQSFQDATSAPGARGRAPRAPPCAKGRRRAPPCSRRRNAPGRHGGASLRRKLAQQPARPRPSVEAHAVHPHAMTPTGAVVRRGWPPGRSKTRCFGPRFTLAGSNSSRSARYPGLNAPRSGCRTRSAGWLVRRLRRRRASARRARAPSGRAGAGRSRHR